jgi:hypothetical protein
MTGRPSGADRGGDGPIGDIAQLAQAQHQGAQHLQFSTEQMRHPANIQHQIAIGIHVAHHRDQRAGIGMPIGKGAESRFQHGSVDFAQGDARQHGAGIRQVLPDAELLRRGQPIDGGQPQAALDALEKRQRPGQAGLSPF